MPDNKKLLTLEGELDASRTPSDLLEQRLLRLERENNHLQEALYSLSHDLKEPVRNAHLTLGLLARQLVGRINENESSLMSAALQSTASVGRLLEAMLAYGQADRDTRVSEYSIQELVNVARENLAYSLRETGAQLSVGPLPVVACDRVQVVRLFQNLLANALKYRREGVPPVISVEATRDDSVWVFQVRDNGMGFDPRDSERIFHLFTRLKKNKAEGTGVGLALCQKIIENHGGTIWAEGRPALGATFCFTLSPGFHR